MTTKTFNRLYQDFLKKYPLAANCLQTGILTVMGVIISQVISAKGRFLLNFSEIKVMGIIATFFIAPVLSWFFEKLEKSKLSVLIQLLIDQFLFGPIFNFFILSLRLYIYGNTPNLLIPIQVLSVLPKTMSYSWIYWIPVRFFTLSYVPSNVQLLVVNIFALIWQVIFSLTIS